MDVEAAAEPGGTHVRAHHINKRALKNKSLAVSFNEKDLCDYVTGFHKRKKKRRKEALQQKEESDRRKRIELRKKRKLERESVYGIAPPDSAPDAAAESGEEHEDDEDIEPMPSVSGTMTYDNGDVQVLVTTSEIAREEETPIERLEPQSVEGFEKAKPKIPVIKKKPVNNPKKRSRAKPQSKRDKKKGKKKNKKQQ
ncbi:hypothetical protein ACJIZ3_006487 [Penstemon smallii]|uniref:Ribosomal RNA-processing protein 17 n=1 Tax=Penstemon smallii TaxID=265156 RepID=A0ABD3S880_9LAMI